MQKKLHRTVVAKAKTVWMDGRYLPLKKAQVPVLTHSLHYGSAVYEGVRFYKTKSGTAIFRLDDHLTRFLRSARAIGMHLPYSKAELTRAAITLIKKNGLRDGYLRPLAFYGGQMGMSPVDCPVRVVLAVWSWPQHFETKAITAHVSPFRWRDPKSIVFDTKVAGYYATSILATLEAKKSGFDEAILLDGNGYVTEGPVENLFMVKNGRLATPRAAGVLPGVTRDTIMRLAKVKGLTVTEKNITVAELKKADEVFFCGTAVEVTPVSHIDKKKIGSGQAGAVTMLLEDNYRKVVHGEEQRFKKWLTDV
ncbi:branched chain amino acid aminotransferase [Candidatus Uhrbacteria bacterium CG10_big_fil_rev_8_21_14_0_10_48_11]|uniref:Branched-chain-amino-acid aminotransferase n=1 Tax=Candidatus Uhrbacteria bacterium CG10_big_fil_rev_8_21_14_0_10_48_11 TaxID=1975037 RepID=A0A2M8LDN1_9BACT|nr:MAG: branched chain amino acid aminotransferase [Candidatus Uhrbacteria bacterium CG10_big_fil_rev_8_21_14_0_10_48_11]